MDFLSKVGGMIRLWMKLNAKNLLITVALVIVVMSGGTAFAWYAHSSSMEFVKETKPAKLRINYGNSWLYTMEYEAMPPSKPAD
jgi:hypothetical protein